MNFVKKKLNSPPALGRGFFSLVSTCFSLLWSNDFTSARESMASSLISDGDNSADPIT